MLSTCKSGLGSESRLLAAEGTELDECHAPEARKDSHEETPVSSAKSMQSSIEGQFPNLANSLQEVFVNLGKSLSDSIKTLC